ncbi:PREDICTED: uncharacterized protein LOC105366071 [Ceratosolen solmsi marchali]|uniref:Structure-specific endonuclease subunit SLX4 n=1 Tax=Ceratosolen solmsi marchali TaxID=326594 RepID=A0AAJ6YR62_9HYME|nr:PREDICTED: uncharacterized protein LOC105366071 [Ceratosolen solmsi marchali]
MQYDKRKTTKIKSKYNLSPNKVKCSSNFDNANTPNCSEDNMNIKISDNKLLYKEAQYSASNAEDSLLDFKSPKKRTIQKSILNKFKIDNRVKKKVLKSKNPPNNKLEKNSTDIVQPAIESSFFKQPTCNQNEVKKPILCPLCLKFFQDDASCTSHMKACAKKKNVSLKELFNAKQLQDQLIEEKKAKGLLLPMPNLPGKKKAYRSKNFNTGDDPQLQLVLAMSKSLYQAQQIEELEHTALLTGVPLECLKNMADQDDKITLQSFGFTTNKTVANIPSKSSKKKKLLGPTILETRSKEDKDRVLTEKIADVLTDNDIITQSQENIGLISQLRSPTILKNKNLQEIEQVNNKLWDKSKLLRKCDFYVKELKLYFLPDENKSSNGRYSYNDINDIQEDILSNKSVVYEPIEDIVYKKNQTESKKLLNNFVINKSKNEYTKQDIKTTIAYNWGEILNDSTESDIIILVKDNRYVYAHKLVFYAQCRNILADLVPNDSNTHPHIKNKISWNKNDQLSALAFLEFIYSGDIHKNIIVFDNATLMLQIKELAKLYKVQSLFLYLNEQHDKIISRKLNDFDEIEDIDNIYNCESNVNTKQVSPNVSIDDIKTTVSPEIQIIETINSPRKSDLPMYPEESENINDNITKSFAKNDFDRRITESPDLFESENEAEIYSFEIQESNQTVKNIKKNSINLSQNIDSSSPINEKPFSPSSIENMHRAVTPTLVSPINCDEIISEMIKTSSPECRLSDKFSHFILIKDESESDQITEAISPEHNISSELNDYITPKKLVHKGNPPDDILDEIRTKNNSLINASLTSSKSNDNNFKSNKQNVYKLKSNLSLFIDKVHKKNAKGIFDTDSETDSPDFNVKKQNPFLKNYQNDSFTYLLNDRNKSRVHKKAISMIENDVLEEENLNKINKIKYNAESEKYKRFSNGNEMCNLNEFSDPNFQIDLGDKCTKISSSNIIKNSTLSSSASDDELENTTINETRMSMYSKYKKLNKYNNSIDKYRNKLDFNISSNIPKAILSQSPITNDISLFYDSDNGELQKSLKTILNEENVYNKSDLVKNIKEKNNGLKLSNSNLSNIDSNLDSLINYKTINESSTSTTKNTTTLKDNKETKIINSILSSDKLACNIIETKNNLTQKNNEIIQENRLEVSQQQNDNVDAEIRKLCQSKTFCPAKGKTLLASKIYCQDSNQEFTYNENRSSQNKIINLSPISIISSPEHSIFDDILNKSNKTDIDLEILESSDNKQIVEFNSVDFRYTNEQEFNKCANINESFASQRNINQNELWNVNTSSNISNRELNKQCYISPKPIKSQTSHASHIISSPILCQNRQNSKTIRIPSSKFNSNQEKRIELPMQLSEKTRKLKVKSVSTCNFNEKEYKKCNLQKSSSFETPKRNKNFLQISSQANITPPINYNLLKTPDLEKELKKFGLKRQSRNKATLLLNHIYNQTHPTVALSQKRVSIFDSSSDEEYLFKKQNLRKKFKSNISKNNESKLNNCSIRADKIHNNGSYITATLESTLSIKEAFFRLIKSNKELYTKVLMYKPLPLESLHSMLKENGFKCKLKDLMNFLDEQCITFQGQTDKGNYMKNK